MVLFSTKVAKLVAAVLFLIDTYYFVGKYVCLGFYCFYYVVSRVAAHWIFQLYSILSDIYRTSIPNPTSGLHLPISITLGEILIALLPTLAAIFLESLQTSSGEKSTWKEREEELKRHWEDQFENERWRLEMERQEMDEKRKDMEDEQKELEDERKELELDIEDREREYVETRDMLLKAWWSERRELEEAEAEARNARMAAREKEEKEYQDSERRRREQEKREYLERLNVERTMWRVEEKEWRDQDEKEYLGKRNMERAKWEQLDIEKKMKWCQMRMPWVQTTVEFKKEMQGMELETPD